MQIREGVGLVFEDVFGEMGVDIDYHFGGGVTHAIG